MQEDDPRLAEARALPIDEVVTRLGVARLKRHGRELAGPCPVCGGRDRFGVNLDKGVWNCRTCGIGGDGLALVRHVLGCEFAAALDWLMGARDVTIDPAVAARRKAEAEARAAKANAEAARRRAAAIAQACAIWAEGRPAAGTAVSAYLLRRGLPAALADAPPACLRFHPDLPFMVAVGDGWREVHRGPAMLAAMRAPSGQVTAVHRTWLDLGQPKGKAVIVHDGAAQPAKKMWGSKKGCAIRLTHEDCRPGSFDTLVMGEGIETTLTSLAYGDWSDRVAHWAGGDLGNMAGVRLHGQGLKYRGHPDMSDSEAFAPPPWVRRLVFIQDGDSEARETRAKLLAGLRRAGALIPGLRMQIVHAPAGRDLNDVVMETGVDA